MGQGDGMSDTIEYVVGGYILGACMIGSLWIMSFSIIVGLLSLVFNSYNLYSCLRSVSNIDKMQKEMREERNYLRSKG